MPVSEPWLLHFGGSLRIYAGEGALKRSGKKIRPHQRAL